jgi:colicin import membrane protein
MGRHAEVTEEEIIQAGQEIERSGKNANSGSIRAKLGGRGGYPRIRVVWEAYKSNSSDIEESTHEINLPTEIEDNLEAISKQVIKQLTQITKSSYTIAQQLVEKRLSSTIEEYKEKIFDFEQFEQDASESIEQCETQINELHNLNNALTLQYEELKSDNIKLAAELSFTKKQSSKLEQKEDEFQQLKDRYSKLQGMYEVLSSHEN